MREVLRARNFRQDERTQRAPLGHLPAGTVRLGSPGRNPNWHSEGALDLVTTPLCLWSTPLLGGGRLQCRGQSVVVSTLHPERVQ